MLPGLVPKTSATLGLKSFIRAEGLGCYMGPRGWRSRTLSVREGDGSTCSFLTLTHPLKIYLF